MNARLVGFSLALLFCLGCYSPQQTVHLMLDGVDDETTWESLRTMLPTLVDGDSGHSMTWSGDLPRAVSLAPVADPKAFSRRIRFATVERIDGRTIYLRVVPQVVQLQAFVLKTKRFFSEFPNTLRSFTFACRLKARAWWTGKSEAELFWSWLNDVPDSERPPAKK
jgi:hypothetical protein